MKFKDDIVKDRFHDMHPKAQELAAEMDAWSVKHHGQELTLTATVSTIEEDKELQRVSDTHRTRRAFDIRVKDLSEQHIAELCAEFRKTWSKYGALVKGVRTLIVYRPHGTGVHLHVQLDRKFQLPIIAYKGKDHGTT